MRIILSILLTTLLGLAWAPSIQAQPRHDADRVIHLPGGGVIHGEAPRPSVVTILPRARVSHERTDSRAHFLPELARSVQQRPF
ncbi:MAG: hypothetical protein GW913_04315 [Myxococcales bacterium]|nr:hypothetical protein [Myxococcales bacterium]